MSAIAAAQDKPASSLPFTERRRERPRPVIAHRTISFVASGEIPICPDGHALRDMWITESGIVRCSHKYPSGGAECHWIAWAIGAPLSGLCEEPVTFFAFVTLEEAMQMRKEHMTLGQCMRFLGLRPAKRAA